jgi:peptidoglycan/xylan/chitin deacetylase (PgdA/CDA1 family)
VIGRWVAKKAARHALAIGAWPFRSSPSASQIRVVTYHRFGDVPFDPFCVTARDFAAQMCWLAEHRLAVSIEDVERFVCSETSLPPGAVLVTIDDGCRSTLTHALPILIEHGIAAVAYVTAGGVGGARPSTHSEELLSWRELGRLAEGGVTIGSHGLTHRSLGRMTLDEARVEATRSRELLEQRLGCPVTTFAYPYGTRADYSDATHALLREAGYRTAFTSQHGSLRQGMMPLALPRLKVEGGDASWMFRRICEGCMDGWRHIDRALWRLQVHGR